MEQFEKNEILLKTQIARQHLEQAKKHGANIDHILKLVDEIEHEIARYES